MARSAESKYLEKTVEAHLEVVALDLKCPTAWHTPLCGGPSDMRKIVRAACALDIVRDSPG